MAAAAKAAKTTAAIKGALIGMVLVTTKAILKAEKEATKAATATIKARRLFLYNTSDVTIKINDRAQNNIK